ncbi:MAG: alpha/beta fold hydrolase [Bdellovibrionales bacterium]
MSESIIITLDGNKHIAALYGQPFQATSNERRTKLVIMAHGFPGDHNAHDNLYGDLESLLNDAGFHTLRFDFFGCGQSSGTSKDFSLQTVKASFDVLKEWAEHNGYKEFVFVSDGLGSVFSILNTDDRLNCQIMLWPGFDPQYLAKSLFQKDAPSQKSLERGYICDGKYNISLSFIDSLSKLKIVPYLKHQTMPVLIMHGAQDDLFPIKHLDIAKRNMSSKRIEITSFHDGGHGLPALNHRQSMFFHITQFIEKYA